MVKLSLKLHTTGYLTAIVRLQAFDELHLLKRGGKTTYAGPTGTESNELISYFEAIPGVPHIQPGMNPATWMLGEPTPSTKQMQVQGKLRT